MGGESIQEVYEVWSWTQGGNEDSEGMEGILVEKTTKIGEGKG